MKTGGGILLPETSKQQVLSRLALSILSFFLSFDSFFLSFLPSFHPFYFLILKDRHMNLSSVVLILPLDLRKG